LSTATKGRRFEHEIRDLFRNAGFSVVRGAGSKGEMLEEKVDLVATKLTRENEFKCFLTLIGVQCKVRQRRDQGVNSPV
jgi:Holliday junction resolvase